MQRSKSYALIFLLGAFIAGGALGFTADRMMSRHGHGRHGGRPSADRMARELKLDPAQRTQFDSIMSRRRAQMGELYKPLRPQMDSLDRIGKAIFDSTHEQLKRLLTPEQITRLDQMRERGRKRGAAHRRGGSDKDRQTPKR